jgi:hypothetical protein
MARRGILRLTACQKKRPQETISIAKPRSCCARSRSASRWSASTSSRSGVKHRYVALQEVLPAAACGDGKRVDTHVLTREYQNLNVSLAHQGPRVRDVQTPWRNLAMNKLPSAAAAVVLSVVIAAPALAQAVIHKPGPYAFDHPNRRSHTFISKLARNREAAMSAMAQARANESSALPPVHGIEGREVSAPPWSFACMNDQGRSKCGEPMWVYGSAREVSRYRRAF